MTMTGLCTVFQNTCVFGVHRENLNEDRPIRSATKMLSNESFLRTLAWVPWRGASNYFFRSFTGKANITQNYLLSRRLCADPTLNDLE